MIWAEPGTVIQVEGRKDVKKLINILVKNLTHTVEATCILGYMPPVEVFIFQQDTDHKHTVGATKQFLVSKS